MSNVLKAADSGIEKVIKTTLFLKNMSDFSKVNQIYEKVLFSAFSYSLALMKSPAFSSQACTIYRRSVEIAA